MAASAAEQGYDIFEPATRDAGATKWLCWLSAITSRLEYVSFA